MLQIPYESEGFPADSNVVNGDGTLNTNWNELLWAAVTVGRPNRQYVFQHGQSSAYEAIFRWSLVRMAVEQPAPNSTRLYRTDAAKSLDPSEKGAVNYFLGMIVCKLFAAKLLDASWLLHLDVFRPELDTVLTGRSRPDLIGATQGDQWISLECKGRLSNPTSAVKAKAKQQAERCISVDGTPVSYHVGGIMFFKNDVLRFFWRDPPPMPGANAIPLTIQDSDWRHYYEPALAVIHSQQADRRPVSEETQTHEIPVPGR